jgi:hypothetical protein
VLTQIATGIMLGLPRRLRETRAATMPAEPSPKKTPKVRQRRTP